MYNCNMQIRISLSTHSRDCWEGEVQIATTFLNSSTSMHQTLNLAYLTEKTNSIHQTNTLPFSIVSRHISLSLLRLLLKERKVLRVGKRLHTSDLCQSCREKEKLGNKGKLRSDKEIKGRCRHMIFRTYTLQNAFKISY